MAKRGRRRARFKVKIRVETVHSLGALFLFALSALSMISFMGKGDILEPLNDAMRQLFGVTALLVPFVFMTAGLVLTGAKWSFAKPQVFLGSVLFLVGASAFIQAGQLGAEFFTNVSALVLPEGAYVLFFSMMVAAVMLATDTSLAEIFGFVRDHIDLDRAERKGEKGLSKIELPSLPSMVGGLKINIAGSDSGKSDSKSAMQGPPVKESAVRDASTKDIPVKTTISAPPTEDRMTNGQRTKAMENDPLSKEIWEYPALSLLNQKPGAPADRGDLKGNVNKIEETLESFGIRAKVLEVNGGPAVTQYAIRIATGTKLSKVTGLANDLALSLAAPTGQVRIEAPIPGKDLVGVEVPNRTLQVVTLYEMLKSDEMKKHPSKLAVALGSNVAGKPVIADIAKMPHVLIAGSTGSGKSVAVNAFIASILFRASPQEVKFIMVDPKRVELTGYNDIPHLISPVIVEAEKVVSALKWAVHEMELRYKRFAEVGVRNIEGFNEFSGFQALPYLVIIIDELADLMLYAPADVEDCITRLAQMARATGIHLVLATQRPSVDVITGLIKANIPTRIAFTVSSGTDSRVIIDQPGAEKLLGRGDMLFVPPDQAKPSRIQGTYVSDKEIRALIDDIRKSGGAPQYEEEITTKFRSSKMGGGSGASGGGDTSDPLLKDAVELFLQEGKASASSLQRRHHVGFGRAGRIIDTLHIMGILGPSEGSKPREINEQKALEFVRDGAVKQES